MPHPFDDLWDDELALLLEDMDLAEQRRMIRGIQHNVKMKEFMREKAFHVQLLHVPTGLEVTRRCGASKAQCTRDAFLELVKRVIGELRS